MPPFEGFDEFAHYSYTQKLADSQTFPHYDDTISQDVQNLRLATTTPYGVDHFAGLRHYDELQDLARVSAAMHNTPDAPRHYTPSDQRNWEVQHPPLFYLLTAPVYKLTNQWNWATHLFAMRAVAFVLAWAGLLIGILLLRRYNARAAKHLLWLPVFVPQFFPEFARYGNDSLCLLIMGLLTGTALSYQQQPTQKKLYKLACLLMAGLLTKALFVPIAAGLALWIVSGRIGWRQTAIPALLTTVAGGAWYIWQYTQTGSAIGADEFISLQQAGGFWANLAHNFNVTLFMKGLAEIAISFTWAGTWSLTHLPYIFHLGLIAPLLVAAYYYLRHFKQNTLPLYIITPVIAGLLYHAFVRMALTGGIGTPGWYLLTLTPVLALISSIVPNHSKFWRISGIYAALYAIVAWTALILLYGGVLRSTDRQTFAFAGQTVTHAWQQLQALALPQLALSFAAATICCAINAWRKRD